MRSGLAIERNRTSAQADHRRLAASEPSTSPPASTAYLTISSSSTSKISVASGGIVPGTPRLP